MPRAPRFTPQHILDAAGTIALRSGLRAVTARAVAAELGASPTVIYRLFPSIEDVQGQALQQLLLTQTAAVLAAAPQDPLRAGALALIRFVAAHPALARDLLLEEPNRVEPWALARAALADALSGCRRYEHLSGSDRVGLVSQVTIPALGIAMVVAIEHLADTSDAHLTKLLDDTVEPIIAAAMARSTIDDVFTRVASP